ncbi:MAG: methionyl-tRNA formyltransferase [Gammaproteobacteria bacterium]|nr:methionyl-tRNA formyltransferase [Gammaproteobacteria bacterium]
MPRLKVLFAGTPDFAVHALEALLASAEVCVQAVYTQPDKPAGRGQLLRQSAVKVLAESHGLPVLQPGSLRESSAIAELAAFQSDLLIVAAYGQILPAQVLAAPRLGSLNVHASLLPRWRGAAPIQRAIMTGDAITGITIMRMVERLDAGPMLLQRACAIAADDTGGSLHERLARLGGVALVQALAQLLAGHAAETAQIETHVTYAKKIERSDRELVWARPASELARQVRALHPLPLATATLGDIRLNVLAARCCAAATTAAPGTLTPHGEGLRVATGDGSLELLAVQPAGKNVMSAREFHNGYRHRIGA